MHSNPDGLQAAIEALRKLDVDAEVAAAERDAGHPIPGLREGLIDAQNGRIAIRTPVQPEPPAPE